MKKLGIMLLAVVLAVTCMSVMLACEQEINEVTINVVMPDGTPVLAVAKMLNNYKQEEIDGVVYKINYEIVKGASEVGAKISSGAADIAIAPTNLVAKLYKKGIDIGLISSNVYGALYIIGNVEVTEISQLADKKVVCTGQGGTPDYIMQYVFTSNGLTVSEMNITYVGDGSEALAKLGNGLADIAVVGEPVASMAESKNKANILFNLQDEYEKITGDKGYPQASTIAKRDLINNHAKFLDEFLDEMEDNLEYIASAQAKDITAAIQAAGSAVTYPNTASIVNSNLKVVRALAAKEGIVEYFGVMDDFDATFYGGSLPVDTFYANILD